MALNASRQIHIEDQDVQDQTENSSQGSITEASQRLQVVLALKIKKLDH